MQPVIRTFTAFSQDDTTDAANAYLALNPRFEVISISVAGVYNNANIIWVHSLLIDMHGHQEQVPPKKI